MELLKYGAKGEGWVGFRCVWFASQIRNGQSQTGRVVVPTAMHEKPSAQNDTANYSRQPVTHLRAKLMLCSLKSNTVPLQYISLLSILASALFMMLQRFGMICLIVCTFGHFSTLIPERPISAFPGFSPWRWPLLCLRLMIIVFCFFLESVFRWRLSTIKILLELEATQSISTLLPLWEQDACLWLVYLQNYRWSPFMLLTEEGHIRVKHSLQGYTIFQDLASAPKSNTLNHKAIETTAFAGASSKCCI